MKTSQKEQVKKILLSTGEVSRNVCIRELYITRLSSIIQILEEEDWEFNPQKVKYEKGEDFVYYLKKTPLKKITYYIKEIDKLITNYV